MNAHADDPGRLVLLSTSHRVAPGLLSWPAWRALHAADLVLCPDPEHPQLPYLRDAGVPVETGAVPVARELLARCAGRTVVVVTGADPGSAALAEELAALAGSGQVTPPELELLPASYDLPGARLLDLVTVMDRLRGPGGCPWDAEQTHTSLVKYLIEEAYELVETIEEGDRKALREELGDVLLQVVFHARIAEEDEKDPFSIDDVAGGIVDKLVYRHPHVFGTGEADTAEQVQANWEQLKAAEKRRTSVTEGVPLGQPALALAAKLITRAEKAGLDVSVTTPVTRPEHPDAHSVGQLLLAVTALACAHGIDAEDAARSAAREYRNRILDAERG
ncbi:nucleoside triphosphate hydrolase [Wenjunlia vitaminophila]|uniref:Nucleoside triphosphate hydrolase n=1 Tax=Wenjunlia vitaminophila TaxID=76728 RepID=A0A0T6LS51_WENVI|nr:MazG family protein [Wenjunlia vitaminophila]KRV48820.1 nucleoside triphosphate hydrolase [Wenjunlia vitaminophila]